MYYMWLVAKALSVVSKTTDTERNARANIVLSLYCKIPHIMLSKPFNLQWLEWATVSTALRLCVIREGQIYDYLSKFTNISASGEGRLPLHIFTYLVWTTNMLKQTVLAFME